jgi:hypothetical protein
MTNRVWWVLIIHNLFEQGNIIITKKIQLVKRPFYQITSSFTLKNPLIE